MRCWMESKLSGITARPPIVRSFACRLIEDRRFTELDKPKCSHPECTGKHSGKWRIGEMCPVAQEKRRASWRAYDQHLYEKHQAAHVARFGSLSSSTAVNEDVRLDLRWMKR